MHKSINNHEKKEVDHNVDKELQEPKKNRAAFTVELTGESEPEMNQRPWN